MHRFKQFLPDLYNGQNPVRSGESSTTKLATRDPQTGKFVSSEDLEDFDRIEEVNCGQRYSVPASEVGGQTGQLFGQHGEWSALELYDFDSILDRDELGVMLWAEHRLNAGILATTTADAVISAVTEISSSTERRVNEHQNTADIEETEGDFTVESNNIHLNSPVTTADHVGRTLSALGFSGQNDGASGTGGGGSAGRDEWVGSPAAEPTFDVRDSLYVNGVLEHSNLDDSAMYASLSVRHVIGVLPI